MPIRVTVDPDPHPSRWLWLVKWLLAIPHYVVLFFLWIAVLVMTVIAFFAILFTGRYPAAVLEFTVGVLRWSWRVTYYGYGALGTDRYPPFTLGDVPDYPARLEVDAPESLSRGLVLVKWWLLAIPHYLVLAAFFGTEGRWVTLQNGTTEWISGATGLLPVLVLFVGVLLLFTDRYPAPLHDLVVGINRWSLRVAAYVLLMTDRYPPLRLDQGPSEPEAVSAPTGEEGRP